MSILYIITQADGGGAQKYVLTLAKHFKGAIAAGQEAQKLFADAKNLQLITYNLLHLRRNINPWHDVMAIFEIRRLIQTLKPDIVHLNSSKAGVIGSFAAIGLKVKVVFTAHGFVFNEPLPFWLKSFYLAAEKIASGYRDMIIAVSEADRKSALEQKLIDAQKISVIHNGIAPLKFLAKDKARSELNLPLSPSLPPDRGSPFIAWQKRGNLEEGKIKGEGDKFIFGTIANFYKTKGLDVLIRAVSMLNNDIKSQLRFVIIGQGAEIENLELEIRKLQLEKVINIVGKIDNAARYLRGFDCFILPSRKEGFSYTLLEAMQAGLPIIATDVGGNEEALADAAIMVKPEDPDALQAAISTVLRDSKTANQISQKALERSRLFTEEKMLAETEKIYQHLLPA